MITVKTARNVIIKAFQNDPDFRRVYVDNVACILMDNVRGFKRNKVKRDEIAEKIIHHILW